MEKKYYDTTKYQFRQICVLTIPEGDVIKKEIEKYHCRNISQLMKLIAYNKISIIDTDTLNKLIKQSSNDLEIDIESLLRKKRIDAILKEYNYSSIEDLKADIEKLNQKNEEDN